MIVKKEKKCLMKDCFISNLIVYIYSYGLINYVNKENN